MEEELQNVQTQLTASVKMQLDSASSALRTLESAQDQLHRIKTSLTGTVDLARQSAALFDDPIASDGTSIQRYHNQYALIRAVSVAHANFSKAKNIYRQLADLERDVERASRLLREDYEGNVLLVAAIVAKLDTFRHSTLRMLTPSGTATSEGGQAVVFTLKRYFKRIDDCKQEFEDRFWQEPQRLFQMLLNKEYSKIVKMAKIMMRMAPQARARMTAVFEELVQNKFQGVKNMIASGEALNLADTLKLLNFYESDLLLIKEGLSSRFPMDMNIVTFFLLSYHRHIAQLVQFWISLHQSGTMSSGDVLELLSWTATYHNTIERLFEVPREDLEPQLLTTRQEQSLLNEFVKESAGKVSEWMQTLIKAECRSFQTRTAAPDLDADNRYYTVSVIDLCRIVKQTVETAASSNLDSLLIKVTTETMRSVQEIYVNTSLTAIKQEWTKQREQTVSAPFLEEWLIAMANNSVRWLTFSADFQDSLLETISEDMEATIGKLFKQANDGFLQLARQICTLLADSVMNTLKPAWPQLFSSPNPADCHRTIDATLSDYFADWQQRMDPFVFAKVVMDVFERSLAAVFEVMRLRPLKTDHESTIADTIDTLHNIFSRHVDPDKLGKPVSLAHSILKLLFSNTPRILALDAVPLFRTTPESVSLVEQCVVRRQDVDKQAFQDAIDGVKRRLKEEGGTEAVSGTTFLRFLSSNASLASTGNATAKKRTKR